MSTKITSKTQIKEEKKKKREADKEAKALKLQIKNIENLKLIRRNHQD